MNGTTNFVWSALAQSGGLTPVYTTGTCTNVYCHGARMPGGDTSGTNRTPVWNSSTYLPATLTAAACGTCHGFPPSTVSGHPAVTIPAGFPATAPIGNSCSCHPNINTAGNSYANIFVNKAIHINGTLDVAAGGACDTCHGYPPVSAGFVGSANNWANARTEDYLGGGGAHTVNSHVSALAVPGGGFTNCSKCHDANDHVMTPIVFNPSQNIKARVNQQFRYEAAKQFKYSSNRLDGSTHLTGTCSNASCHLGATPKWDLNH
jgi:predicted CxxxxCH...CXXCH cytochrome family protein